MGCEGKCSGENDGIKIPFVNDNCIGCGACVAICDTVFDMDDEGKAFVKEGMNSGNADCIEDSIGVCPVDAIQFKN